jgi:hypothetical protein
LSSLQALSPMTTSTQSAIKLVLNFLVCMTVRIISL